MTTVLAAFLFAFGVTVDSLVVLVLYRRVKAAVRARRRVAGFRERIAAYHLTGTAGQ